jgi:hypothetical protein
MGRMAHGRLSAKSGRDSAFSRGYCGLASAPLVTARLKGIRSVNMGAGWRAERPGASHYPAPFEPTRLQSSANGSLGHVLNYPAPGTLDATSPSRRMPLRRLGLSPLRSSHFRAPATGRARTDEQDPASRLVVGRRGLLSVAQGWGSLIDDSEIQSPIPKSTLRTDGRD